MDTAVAPQLLRVLGGRGFRVFFPARRAPARALAGPRTLVQHLRLPFAITLPYSLWHAQEMLIGGLGAALIAS
jgi:uncharacterized protein involved in response to NO